MRKTLLTAFCSAVIAASSIQVAAAVERHHVRKTLPKSARISEPFRNPDSAQPPDTNVYALCGNLPGPCQ